MAVTKHASMVFGLSLFASTASASIPDANGVIHGCYNVLTGSTRIIDGNSCGFLEKTLTWNQTGPRGPVGPQGPQGPSGSNDIVVGSGDALIHGAVAPNTETYAYISDSFTPTTNGVCNIQIHGEMNAQVPGTFMIFSAELGGGTGRTSGYAGAPFINYVSPIDTGSVAHMSLHLPVQVGETYRFGVDFVTREAPVMTGTTASFDVTYTCTGGPNAT